MSRKSKKNPNKIVIPQRTTRHTSAPVIPSPEINYGPLLAVGILLAVLAIYFPVGSFRFLKYDDNVNVYANPLVMEFSWTSLGRIWSAPYEGMYIPLTYTAWAVLAKLSVYFPSTSATTLTPHLFHKVNLALHATNTIILFGILRKVRVGAWGAAAGALLFALHPVQVEAVAWVTGLKDLLSSFFCLLAIWQYLLHLQRLEGEMSRRAAYHYGAMVVFFLAALLAKPGAVALPLLLLAFGLLQHRPLRSLGKEILPLFLLALPLIVITKISQPGSQSTVIPALGQRFLIAGDAVSFYLTKLLWPVNLGPDYGRHLNFLLNQDWLYVSGLLPYALFSFVLWKWRSRWVLCTIGLFVAPLLPVLGFIPFRFQEISTVADRYLYLSLLGPALACGLLITHAKYRTVVAIGVSVIIVLLAGKTIDQVYVWENPLIFNKHAVSVNPKSWLARTNLGVAQMNVGRYRRAALNFQKAIEENPTYIIAYSNLGTAYSLLGKYDEAVATYKEAMEVNPYYFMSYIGLCNLYLDRQEFEAARIVFRQAVELFYDFETDPDQAKDLTDALSRRETALPLEIEVSGRDKQQAMLYNILGRILQQAEQPEKAVQAYAISIDFDSRQQETHNNLGNLYASLNRNDAAVAAYTKAIELKPNGATAYENLCILYSRLEQHEQAKPVCKKAIELKPESSVSYLELGNIHLSLQHLAKAATAYEKALEISPGYALAAINLAATYQQMGKITKAIEVYQQIIRLNPELAKPYGIYATLGLLYQQNNDINNAYLAFQEAVKLNPADVSSALMLEKLRPQLEQRQ